MKNAPASRRENRGQKPLDSPDPKPTADTPTAANALYSTRPVDPSTGEPLPPRAQPGYYPGYSTLNQRGFWDEATRNVVLKRVNEPPPIRFFAMDEVPLMQAVIDRILPQDDRDAAHRIPILHYIDDRLYNDRIDGYRYEDMPPDAAAHRLGLQAIQAIAVALYSTSFIQLDPVRQERVLSTIHDGNPPAAHHIWEQMSVHRYWQLLVQDCVAAYYAHPYAWDEIGFGGPAYPRGYMRLEHGQPEPWEVEEQRYAWAAPPWSMTNEHKPVGGRTSEQGAGMTGQGGTH